MGMSQNEVSDFSLKGTILEPTRDTSFWDISIKILRQYFSSQSDVFFGKKNSNNDFERKSLNMAKFLISYGSNLISRWKFTCCWLISAQLSAEQQLPLVKISNSTNHKKMKNWSCSNNYAFISLKVLLVGYLWCNCFSVWRSLFFYGVLLATWLLHLLYYMCLTWEFNVDVANVATVGYRLAAQQMRFYLWPVQSIHGKNRLIEK